MTKVLQLRASIIALITALVPLTAFAAGGEMPDEPASTIDLEYRLYAGGIPLGQVDFNARIRADSYSAASTLDTVGLASAVWKAHLEGTSYGTFLDGNVRPTTYEAFSMHSATDNQRRQVTLSYTNGLPAVTTTPPYSNPIILEDRYMQDTFDPIGAIVFATNSYAAHTASPCELSAPVFDGRRSYRMSLDMVRRTNVNMDNGLYRGPVDICQIEFEPVAGADQQVFEGGNIPDTFMWVTSVQSTADPSRRFLLPLRIWAETDYGVVVVLLTGISVDGVQKTSLN
jgi:hypothetical protein